MVIAPGQQAGAGGGAQRGGVEVGQPDPVPGQSIDDRRLDGRAVAAQLGEADIIEHDQDHIGRPLGRRGLRGPPWFRIPPVPTDPASECHTHQFAPSRFGSRMLPIATVEPRVRRWSPRKAVRFAGLWKRPPQSCVGGREETRVGAGARIEALRELGEQRSGRCRHVRQPISSGGEMGVYGESVVVSNYACSTSGRRSGDAP